jgi:hypothetical protein
MLSHRAWRIWVQAGSSGLRRMIQASWWLNRMVMVPQP